MKSLWFKYVATMSIYLLNLWESDRVKLCLKTRKGKTTLFLKPLYNKFYFVTLLYITVTSSS